MSAGHGEEAAGRLVAIADTEEEIPRFPAVPHTTTDSVRSSNSSPARSESSQEAVLITLVQEAAPASLGIPQIITINDLAAAAGVRTIFVNKGSR